MTSSGVRAELRQAAEIRADLGLRSDSKQEMWVRDTATDRLINDLKPLLAERDALAEQVAQAEQRADNLRHDLRQEVASANGLHAALARAEQREAGVRGLIADWQPSHNAVVEQRWIAIDDVLAALNEGDPDADN